MSEKHKSPPKQGRVIYLRPVDDLHSQLKDIAWREKTSLNKICLLALEQFAINYHQEAEQQKKTGHA